MPGTPGWRCTGPCQGSAGGNWVSLQRGGKKKPSCMEEAFSIFSWVKLFREIVCFWGECTPAEATLSHSTEPHNLPATGRYLSSVLPVLSASPPARKPLVPALMSRKKTYLPLGTCLTGAAPLLAGSPQPELMLRWAVVEWASVETSFLHCSQFPLASRRGFDLFLPTAPKHRLLADVSACNLFHDVSPYAWAVLFTFLSIKPVHPLI